MASFCHAKLAGSLAPSWSCADEKPTTHTKAAAAVEYKRLSRSKGGEVVTIDMCLTPLRCCSQSPSRRDRCPPGHENQNEHDLAKRALVGFYANQPAEP